MSVWAERSWTMEVIVGVLEAGKEEKHCAGSLCIY